MFDGDDPHASDVTNGHLFGPAARHWFAHAFAAPTPVQDRGWRSIAAGNHTLLLAPTGSGKTLAAFFAAIDRLSRSEQAGTKVLYVSPLKALVYDIERNLIAPARGVAASARLLGLEPRAISIGTRTGDTSPADRRDLVRHPPDILVTTPESLYLMLTSEARHALASVDTVIIDEIHAIAGSKRGVHLALSLERLTQRVCAREPQRIGLSATQRPLNVVAEFLGGYGSAGEARPVEIVDASEAPHLGITVRAPVEDYRRLGTPTGARSGNAANDAVVRHSVWPAITQHVLDEVRRHRSTLVFVNARRAAERLATNLNELAGEPLARAHHGSVAADQRHEIEEALKAGTLPVLVATSSLELGIDMGTIDYVALVESPPSVASGLQRLGRAGHQVGMRSLGEIVPKFRHDLLIAAVVAHRMARGEIEATVVPRQPLDVLAQHVVAMTSVEDLTPEELLSVVRAASPYSQLDATVFASVLDLLAGAFDVNELPALRARLDWDRANDTLRARKGARLMAITAAGTIPERGLYRVVTPEGHRVGELDEEMVFESRPGETVVLGATTWRIEDIGFDKVTVTPAPGQVGKTPFWKGDSLGRPAELGRAIGRFLGEAPLLGDDELAEWGSLDKLATQNLRAYLEDQIEATGALPTDRRIIVESVRDELGDWRLCVLSPFGARVHAPWCMVAEMRLRDELGLPVSSLWTDDGFVLRVPELDTAPRAEALRIDPQDIERLAVSVLGDTELFGGRFRDNAARALLLPRRRVGKRTPLWQLRQRAADLLAVARRHPTFPIVLETYRECLHDLFDLPALVTVLTELQEGTIELHEVSTDAPSPFASGLAAAYLATFMYEGDQPLAERRVAALGLDHKMLATLLGSGELRTLLGPEVIVRTEAQLQGLHPESPLAPEAALDLLRQVGDLTRAELTARGVSGDVVEQLLGARSAGLIRVTGEERVIAMEDAGKYRDGLGCVPPAGTPTAFLVPFESALGWLVERYARRHGPFGPGGPGTRYGIPAPLINDIAADLVARGRLLAGEFTPAGSGLEWCHPEVLELIRRRTLAAARDEVEPVDAAALCRFRLAWHKVGAGGGPEDHAGPDKRRAVSEETRRAQLLAVIEQLQGHAAPVSAWESDILPARVAEYRRSDLDAVCSSGDVAWVGAGVGIEGGRVRLIPTAQLETWTQVLNSADGTWTPEAARILDVLANRGASFFRQLDPADDRVTRDALWELVWAGRLTNDTFGPARSWSPARRTTSRRRPPLARAGGPPDVAGRWWPIPPSAPRATAYRDKIATLLLNRFGILGRATVAGLGLRGGFSGLYSTLSALELAGRAHRGHFVDLGGGAQFATRSAPDLLRRAATTTHNHIVVHVSDPALPYFECGWPEPGAPRGGWVVLDQGVPVAAIDAAGTRVTVYGRQDDPVPDNALAALLDHSLRPGRLRRAIINTSDTQLREALLRHLFVDTPKGLTRHARG